MINALRQLLRVGVIAILVASSTAAGAQTSFPPGQEPPAASRLPPNYRELFAQWLRARNVWPIRDAKISKPYAKYGGILRGGTYPVVCVAVSRDHPMGHVVHSKWIMTFDEGKVKQLLNSGLDPCDNLRPYPELKRR